MGRVVKGRVLRYTVNGASVLASAAHADKPLTNAGFFTEEGSYGTEKAAFLATFMPALIGRDQRRVRSLLFSRSVCTNSHSSSRCSRVQWPASRTRLPT